MTCAHSHMLCTRSQATRWHLHVCTLHCSCVNSPVFNNVAPHRRCNVWKYLWMWMQYCTLRAVMQNVLFKGYAHPNQTITGAVQKNCWNGKTASAHSIMFPWIFIMFLYCHQRQPFGASEETLVVVILYISRFSLQTLLFCLIFLYRRSSSNSNFPKHCCSCNGVCMDELMCHLALMCGTRTSAAVFFSFLSALHCCMRLSIQNGIPIETLSFLFLYF